MAAAITAAPSVKASNLTTPTREGGQFTAKWKVPSDATNESNPRRWQNVVVAWFVTYNAKVNGTQKVVKTVRKLAPGTTENSMTLVQADLYPARGGAANQVLSVTVRVRGWNGKGYGPNVDATLTMVEPAGPTVSVTYDDETGRVRAVVGSQNVDGARHRYDSQVWMKREGAGGTSMLVNGSAGTGTSRTFTQDIANASRLTAGQYVRVTASARARGMRGNGATVSKSYTIAHPNRPTCGTPSLSYAQKGVLTSASVVIPVTNQGQVTLKDGSRVYPTTIRLQRLKDSASKDATSAAAEEGWADVEGAVDSGTCAGLVDTWADGVSEDGKRTWYRVAAIRDGYTQYGSPVFAKCIYVPAPTVSAGTASITSLSSNAAGNAAVVRWSRSGFSTGGGIEFSWSDYSGAWSSTTPPSTYELDTNAASGSRNVSGLTAGTKYYVRVRPYAVAADGTKRYGKYCATSSVTVEASTGTASITSIEQTSERNGAKVVVAKGQASDAIEISWSDEYWAWTSNSAPQTALTTTGGTTKTWYVYGLETGVQYYFRVRPVDGQTYGAYSTRTAFSIQTRAANVGEVSITSAATGEDGQTVVVTLSRTDASDGVELSWSDDEQAWGSTKGPDTHDVEGFNGNDATVYVKGLTEGVPYHFRARCTRGSESGEWCTPVSATPYGSPGTVLATVPEAIASGEALNVAWSHDGDGTQRGWRVVVDGSISASGSDSRGAASVAGLGDGEHAVTVDVSTGGDWVSSDESVVLVAARPTGSVTVPQVTTAQPLSLALVASEPGLSANVGVLSRGCAEDDLHDAQPDGLSVWSGTIDGIEWQQVGDSYVATVELPAGIDLRDGAGYAVAVSLYDDSTGLGSEVYASDTVVAWGHQAVAPGAVVTAYQDDLSAEIELFAPDGAEETDVADVWRVTPDGTYLIAEGRQFGTVVRDGFAPFVERGGDWVPSYRVATRTVDGDVDFADVPYDLRSDRMRIDWGAGRSVELEYGLSGSEGWSKDFEAITHLDGSVGGSWSRGTKRTAKLSGVLVRTETSEEQAALRELAKACAPAFVRTSNGSAYMAHVTVGALAFSDASHQVSATVNAQELDLTAEFMADPVEEA